MSRSFTTPPLKSRWRLSEGSLDLAVADTDSDPRIKFPEADMTREADRWMSVYGEQVGEPGDHPAGLPDAVVLAILPALCGDEQQSEAARAYLNSLLAVAAKVSLHNGPRDHYVAAAARENARLGAEPPSDAMRRRYAPTEAALSAKWTGGQS